MGVTNGGLTTVLWHDARKKGSFYPASVRTETLGTRLALPLLMGYFQTQRARRSAKFGITIDRNCTRLTHNTRKSTEIKEESRMLSLARESSSMKR